MKAGWQTKKLGDVCAFDKAQGIHHHLPYVGLENIESQTARFIGSTEPQSMKSSTFRFSNQHVLYGRLRPYLNKVLVPDFEGHCSTEIFPIKPSIKLSREYLLYWFLSDETVDRINATCTGARMPRADMNEVLGFDFPLPPLSEQQRIVGILDEAFENIATAKATADRNIQNAHALSESYLQSVFSPRGKGWISTALGSVCGFVRGPFGGSLKKSIFVAHGYAVYEQQHAIYNQFDNVRYFIDKAKFMEMKRFELLPNDLIMSCSGTMGRVAIVPEGIKKGIINQALLKLTPTTKILNTYLKSWMESAAFQDALKEYSGGAAIQNVASVQILKEIKVPLPSVEEQQGIVDELDALSAETEHLESVYQQKFAALEALKKSLLHQALAGKL
jgi:type I restriction enzyme S subunit